MKSRWSEAEASNYTDDLSLRAYSSRLLGADSDLVLHGGGNTSVKITERNAFGEPEEILRVKGSGWDLSDIQPQGFSPVRLEHLRKLATLPSLSDTEMVNEMLTHMTLASAPVPSVEAILHAILPHKWVDHTHADAIITLTNSVDGEQRIRDLFGELVVVLPYVMPGFELARLCASEFPKRSNSKTIGMILLNHGIFSFADSARESYERMIALVSRAEDYLKSNSAWSVEPASAVPCEVTPAELSTLRRGISDVAGSPVIVRRYSDSKSLAFAKRKDVASVATRGPATPDHVIRTKRIPMIGRDVEKYAKDYGAYFDANDSRTGKKKKMLDSAPRVVIDAKLGILTVGRSAREALVAGEIYSHTIDVISRAELLGGYRALPGKDIFDVEYWDLEQAKLARAPARGMFSGEVALITGSASGIGRACADSCLSRGAAVVGMDINPQIASRLDRADFLGLEGDVTSEKNLASALEKTVNAFGGLDILVLNAGIFPGGKKIEDLGIDEWSRVMRVNVDANLMLLRAAHPLLKQAPRGGRIVVIGSKNVAAPGPGAAAYSASKAALNQLARVVALEWAADGIRINSLHPDAVFDTGLWTDDVIAARASHYGVSVEQYRKKNLLKTEITSADVGELAAELCGPRFAKTTGAHIPVDGGSDRII